MTTTRTSTSTSTRTPMEEMHDFLDLPISEQERLLITPLERFCAWYDTLTPLERYRHDRDAVLYRLRTYREVDAAIPVSLLTGMITKAQQRLAEIRATYYRTINR